jgi:hypothetical protein
MSNMPSPPQWLEADDNPYGVRCLDCRGFTRTVLASTSDPGIARLFAELRNSAGEQHRGKVPPDSVVVECNLRYPHQGETKDGPVFIAQEMEDKWDIYLYDGYLYFARSWTGALVFRAKIDFTGQEAVLSLVEANPQVAADDPDFVIRQVDFLVKSHLYRIETPHPLPPDFPDDPEQIALYSFSQYGRWASFATYEDVLGLA